MDVFSYQRIDSCLSMSKVFPRLNFVHSRSVCWVDCKYRCLSEFFDPMLPSFSRHRDSRRMITKWCHAARCPAVEQALFERQVSRQAYDFLKMLHRCWRKECSGEKSLNYQSHCGYFLTQRTALWRVYILWMDGWMESVT